MANPQNDLLEKGEQAEQGEGISFDIVKLKKILLEQLTLVSITLNDDDNDNSYLIFESLNYKSEVSGEIFTSLSLH